MMLTIEQKTFNLEFRPLLMAILNVTPDSFSDGGTFKTTDALKKFIDDALMNDVEIIDIGGESSRPGANPVTLEEELKRTIPVIEFIKSHCPIPLSIDTYKSVVAEKALESGASMINDISGGLADENIFTIAAKYNVPYVLMHMNGTPKTMQNNLAYTHPVDDITHYFSAQIQKAERVGIEQIIIDPGIGFGKTYEHNFYLINHLSHFLTLKKPLLIGASRKSFLAGEKKRLPADREEATLVVHSQAVMNGARIVRTHQMKKGRKMIETCISLLKNQ